MTRIRALLILAAVMFVCLPAQADTANVYVNGSYAFGSFGYGIGPYGGTLNGSAASFYCVDFSHDIFGQTGWTTTVTNLPTTAGSSLPGTLLGSSTLYLDMAYMITQMMNASANTSLATSQKQTLEAEYQWAIWSLSLGSNPSAPFNPYGTNGTLVSQAQSAVNGGWAGSGWEILTPQGGTGYSQYGRIPGTYGQEFMVLATPEPASMLLLATGLLAIAAVGLKKS